MYKLFGNPRHRTEQLPRKVNNAFISLGASYFPKSFSLNNKCLNPQIKMASEEISKAFLLRGDLTDSLFLDLFNSSCTPQDQMILLSTWLKERSGAFENLFVIFNGHGREMGDGRIQLALSSTNENLREETTLSPQSLAKVMDEQQSRVFVIFDCCFAAGIMGPFMTVARGVSFVNTDETAFNSGWWIVGSCGRNEVIHPTTNYGGGTPLSMLIARLLNEGIPHKGPRLSMYDLVESAREQIRISPWVVDGKDDASKKRYPICAGARLFAGDASRKPLFENAMYDDSA